MIQAKPYWMSLLVSRVYSRSIGKALFFKVLLKSTETQIKD